VSPELREVLRPAVSTLFQDPRMSKARNVSWPAPRANAPPRITGRGPRSWFQRVLGAVFVIETAGDRLRIEVERGLVVIDVHHVPEVHHVHVKHKKHKGHHGHGGIVVTW
jgi:hypothetical protein